MKKLAALAAVCWALIVASSVRAEPQPPVTIDSYGYWSLERLGYSDIELPDSEISKQTVQYRLPTGAKQGPDDWYLVHLHVVLEFTDASSPGRVWLLALTNGEGVALIEVNLDTEGGPRVTWETTSLQAGDVSEQSESRRAEIRFSNYVQFSGIKEGVNTLTFVVQQVGDTQLKGLKILSDSGIEFTDKSPPQLGLTVTPSAERVNIGDHLNLDFEVRNHGDWNVDAVTVAVLHDQSALLLVGPERQELTLVGAGVKGSIELIAKKEGTHQVTATARGAGDYTASTYDVRVGTPHDSESLLDFDTVLGAALMGVGSALTLTMLVSWGRRLVKRR